MKYLIDGHNFIFTQDNFFLQPHERGRVAELVNAVDAYIARHPSINAEIVLDSSVKGTVTNKRIKGRRAKVTYATRARDADQYIILMVQKAENPRQITVVSSDKEVIRACRQAGAQTMSCERFAKLISLGSKTAETKAEKPPPPSSKEEIKEWKKFFNLE